MGTMPRATIVGSGPNGLSSAVALARAGFETRVVEHAATIGGGARTLELTLPGFRHDVCSAVHPAGLASPFFRAFGLREKIGWHIPEVSYAHPLDDGRAVLAWRDVERSADALGRDGRAWRALFRPLASHIEGVTDFTSHELIRIPRHPVTTVRFGLRVLEQATRFGDLTLRTEEARALLAGVMAHAGGKMPSLSSSGAGMMLAAHAHAAGWGLPLGGSQSIIDAFVDDLSAHGGRIDTTTTVTSLADLDWGDAARGDVLILDTSPRLLLTHPDLPASYARGIQRFRYSSGVAKVDFALSGPVPWANPDVSLSPTVHLGGTAEDIRRAENMAARGSVSERPYVLVVQPSIADPSRAPEGGHVLWAYTHTPAASALDAEETITRQIERFAPGFRDTILASASRSAADRESDNPAEIDGHIFGGDFTIWQSLKRPVLTRQPWRTPIPGVYLGSASTPPGPAVHGMAGWLAARLAIRDAIGERVELPELFG